jgi:hypothetical protein
MSWRSSSGRRRMGGSFWDVGGIGGHRNGLIRIGHVQMHNN